MPEAIFDPPWNERVRFDPAGGFAYAPNTAFTRDSGVDRAFIEDVLAEGESLDEIDDPPKLFRAMRGTFDAIRVVANLRARGIDAQPDHVMFAHDMSCCCCGPHPAAWFDPVLVANPFHANPFHANPFHANPFHANPFHANPFHANPMDPNGPTRSSARPADPPRWYTASSSPSRSTRTPGAARWTPRIVVIDTGLARQSQLPDFLRRAPGLSTGGTDVPDVNRDRWLDPVAGHGTFIAGIIERIAPGCAIEVIGVLGPQGEGRESAVVDAINYVAGRDIRPAFLNLSFGGYVWDRAPMLSEAVLHAQRRGIVVVASAGNDGTCRPSFPAAIPGVVSVGAIGPDGPAWFSNYGDWVRACAPGMDVVSSFFRSFNGPEVPSGGRDIDRFKAWATWSGTSFAAPAVIGALVREMRSSPCTASEAVTRLIDAPWLGRIPGLGTVVNV
jgi:subtilase family protein